MVLKLHRFDHPPLAAVAEVLITLTSQARSGLLSSDQGEARLHGETQVSVVDVHVSPRRTKGVGLHEGSTWEFRPRAAAYGCSLL